MNLSKVRTRGLWFLSILIGAWLVLLFVAKRYDSVPAKLVGPAIVMTICASVFVVVERRVLDAPRVDANIICGGIACYFLIAIVWALGFVVIDEISPGSFDWHQEGELTLSHVIYFSLTCVSTLGFGDVVPLSPFARIFATFEAVAGTIYISVFIARLVSLYRR